jgi:hypothetical protein
VSVARAGRLRRAGTVGRRARNGLEPGGCDRSVVVERVGAAFDPVDERVGQRLHVADLDLPERGVEAIAVEQVLVGALLDDFAVVEDEGRGVAQDSPSGRGRPLSCPRSAPGRSPAA